jgi:hypothetical protein
MARAICSPGVLVEAERQGDPQVLLIIVRGAGEARMEMRYFGQGGREHHHVDLEQELGLTGGETVGLFRWAEAEGYIRPNYGSRGREVATPSNTQATAKITHLGDAPSFVRSVGLQVLYSQGRGLAHLLPAPRAEGAGLSRRLVVLLAAAAVAVAMLAVSASAWGQDAAQGDGGMSLGASDRGDPVIKPKQPKPGEKISDRTPAIKAKVFDRDSKLTKQDIKLKLDNNRVKQRDFTYKSRKEILTHTPGRKLSRGKHTVKITAGPKGDRATRTWSFKIQG